MKILSSSVNGSLCLQTTSDVKNVSKKRHWRCTL